MSLSKRSVTDAQGLMGMKKEGEPTKPLPLTEDQLRAFGTIGGTSDVKGKATYLAKKGLIGASQLISDKPDISTRKGIINAQSDWKTAAFETMLMKARTLNLKTPTEIAANRDALLGALRPELKEAINHPVFNSIHPNWWDTFNSVLKDQYANESAQPPSANLAVK